MFLLYHTTWDTHHMRLISPRLFHSTIAGSLTTRIPMKLLSHPDPIMRDITGTDYLIPFGNFVQTLNSLLIDPWAHGLALSERCDFGNKFLNQSFAKPFHNTKAITSLSKTCPKSALAVHVALISGSLIWILSNAPASSFSSYSRLLRSWSRSISIRTDCNLISLITTLKSIHILQPTNQAQFLRTYLWPTYLQ